MTAKEFLRDKGIHPTEPIYWDLVDRCISLDELMSEFSEQQNKQLIEENERLKRGQPSCKKHDLRKIEYSHECRTCGELFTI